MSSISMNVPMASQFGRATARHRPTGSVQLTRRGRIVLFLVTLLAAAALLVAFGPISTATNDDVPARITQVVTIHSGDTLWGLAAGLTGGSHETDAMVRTLMEMNNLDEALVFPGQKLRVPLI